MHEVSKLKGTDKYKASLDILKDDIEEAVIDLFDSFKVIAVFLLGPIEYMIHSIYVAKT